MPSDPPPPPLLETLPGVGRECAEAPGPPSLLLSRHQQALGVKSWSSCAGGPFRLRLQEVLALLQGPLGVDMLTGGRGAEST